MDNVSARNPLIAGAGKLAHQNKYSQQARTLFMLRISGRVFGTSVKKMTRTAPMGFASTIASERDPINIH